MPARAEGTRRRPGRTAGAPPNRETILAVARGQFAERGYDSTTIRSIAGAAGVDPALVHHYFGSKDQLFASAVRFPMVPGEFVPQLIAGGVDGLGERLLRRFLGLWSTDPAAMVGLIRSATSHEYAARMLREFVTKEVLERIAEALEMPQPRLRAALVASQLVGLAVARFVVRLEPIASADPETLVACYAPTLQRYLAGPLPGDEG
jgi:AcrR family transcriptional regulator